MWGPIDRVELTAVRQVLLITEFHLEQLTYNYHHNKAVPLHANQAQMGNGNIALHMLDPSARMVGVDVSATPRPLYPRERDPVSLVQKAGWFSRLVWMGPENLAFSGVRGPDRPARSESLYQLRYPGRPVTIIVTLKPLNHIRVSVLYSY